MGQGAVATGYRRGKKEVQVQQQPVSTVRLHIDCRGDFWSHWRIGDGLLAARTVRRIETTTAETRSFAFLMQRCSVLIQRGNAVCVAAGLHRHLATWIWTTNLMFFMFCLFVCLFVLLSIAVFTVLI